MQDAGSPARWRQRLGPRSFRVCHSWLYRFLLDAGLSPDEAVVWAAGAKKTGEQSLILDKMHDFILTCVRCRYKMKQLAYCTLRSFPTKKKRERRKLFRHRANLMRMSAQNHTVESGDGMGFEQ